MDESTFEEDVRQQRSSAAREDTPPDVQIETAVEEPQEFSTEGKRRIVKNAVMNLLDEFAFAMTGFIWPRLMLEFFSHGHGRVIAREMVGVWDFGWDTVLALKLLNAGVSSSVNRYVAKFRAVGDWLGLNRSVSACGCIFTVAAAAAAIITLFMVLTLDRMIPAKLLPYAEETRWIVLCFGLMSAIEMYMGTYNGVTTGFQRYDLTAYTNIGINAIQLTCLTATLFLGYGLKAVAIVMLGIKLIESATIWIISHRVCPTLRFSPRLVRRQDVRQVLKFGLKTFMNYIGDVVTTTGSSWLITFQLGPGSLSLLKRSTALIRHVRKLMFQVTRGLTPVSSEAQALGHQEIVRKLTQQAVQYCMLLGIPASMALGILSKPVLRLWLKDEAFFQLPLLPILVLGNVWQLMMMGPRHILVGLNKHGWTGMIGCIGAVLTLVLLGVTILGFPQTGLVGVAVCIAVAQMAMDMIGTPIVLSRSVGLPVWKMFSFLPRALLLSLPFGIWLLLWRFGAPLLDWLMPALGLPSLHLMGFWESHRVTGDLLVIVCGLGGGFFILLASYWRTALPDTVRSRLQSWWRRIRREEVVSS